jgi:hypothetical protein
MPPPDYPGAALGARVFTQECALADFGQSPLGDEARGGVAAGSRSAVVFDQGTQAIWREFASRRAVSPEPRRRLHRPAHKGRPAHT